MVSRTRRSGESGAVTNLSLEKQENVNGCNAELPVPGSAKRTSTFDLRAVNMLVASTQDGAAILSLQRAAFHRQGILYNDMTLPPLVQTLEEMVRDFDEHVFLKALFNDRIVGSVRGRVEGDVCRISRLAVHPDHQNRGIGKMLMTAIEERFVEAKRFELFTGHKSEKSLAFYGRLGYREVGRVRASESVVHVRMEKANR